MTYYDIIFNNRNNIYGGFPCKNSSTQYSGNVFQNSSTFDPTVDVISQENLISLLNKFAVWNEGIITSQNKDLETLGSQTLEGFFTVLTKWIINVDRLLMWCTNPAHDLGLINHSDYPTNVR